MTLAERPWPGRDLEISLPAPRQAPTSGCRTPLPLLVVLHHLTALSSFLQPWRQGINIRAPLSQCQGHLSIYLDVTSNKWVLGMRVSHLTQEVCAVGDDI